MSLIISKTTSSSGDYRRARGPQATVRTSQSRSSQRAERGTVGDPHGRGTTAASAGDPVSDTAMSISSISAADQAQATIEKSSDANVSTATSDRPANDPITTAIETIKQMDPETLASLARAFIKPAPALG